VEVLTFKRKKNSNFYLARSANLPEGLYIFKIKF